MKRSKKIIIQEVEDQRRDEDVTETGLYTIIIRTYIQVIYLPKGTVISIRNMSDRCTMKVNNSVYIKRLKWVRT